MKIPTHQSTTAQLGSVFPFVSSRPLPAAQVLVGRDLFGTHFVHDPFELYRSGALSNPNMVVIGQIGRGKSAFVKSYLYRQAAFGRRIVVFDPKGEYGPLAAALGASPIRIYPGGPLRLNPLDNGAAHNSSDSRAVGEAQLSGLESIAGACLGRQLRAVEHAAIELALRRVIERVGMPTLPHVVAELFEPDRRSARELHTDESSLAEDSREVALELRRLVTGDLQGMFDGPTSPSVDLGAHVVVIDLSAVFQSTALSVLLACARSTIEVGWVRSLVPTIMVVDEAWAMLSNVGAARFLQSSFKLARAHGVSNIAVVHRASDLSAAGAEGSIEARLAEGMIADSETFVCFAQSPRELQGAAYILGLSDAEVQMLAGLRRGVALWRVGGRSYLVQHRLSPVERAFVDTDARLRD